MNNNNNNNKNAKQERLYEKQKLKLNRRIKKDVCKICNNIKKN